MTSQKQTIKKEEKISQSRLSSLFPQRLLGMLADEIAGMVVNRITYLMPTKKSKQKNARNKLVEHSVFLDTSAIIDGRIFDVSKLGLLYGVIAVPAEILLELKHIADSQDLVKRERGRKGLEALERLKKTRGIKVIVLPSEEDQNRRKEVDEVLIAIAKKYTGRIITCDYNLEKKASIQGVAAINVNALANALKVTAVPGESLHIKVLHQGKDITQGVGYLDDGTMVVVEHAADDIERMVDIVVSRVIQTASGRILFAKKI